MLKSVLIPRYNKQKVTPSAYRGIYTLENTITEKQVPLTIEEYKELVMNEDPNDKPFNIECKHEIEKKMKSIWSTIKTRSPIYASDVEGSLFPETMKRWNINKFTSDDPLLHEMNEDEWMDGIHYSFLYVGSKGSLFSFHVEDQNLNSISYLHEGAPKVWYGVSAEFGPQFEDLMMKAKDPNDMYAECDKPMRHKTIFIDRKLLENAEFNVTEVCSWCFWLTNE